MKFNAPRGTHDLYGDNAAKITKLESIARAVFKKYNYSEIRVPTFEDAGLFTRSIGETSDIVEKEMYVFNDRKGRKLALRPEGTASVVRSLIENNLDRTLASAKLFYMGSMFRYERPQAGRYREFFQIGAEYFGVSGPSADAEIILLAMQLLESAGVQDATVLVNSLGCPVCRPAFRQALLDLLKSKEGELCDDCAKRIERNPLRVLDCKIDSPKITTLPIMEEFLCAECKDHFEMVKALLNAAGCKFSVDSKLVRGLDYYNRTVFEVRSSKLGAQDAVAAGGRYDKLVNEIGGPNIAAVGFALGSERVIMASDMLQAFKANKDVKTIFVATAGNTILKAFNLASLLRSSANTKLIVEGPLAGAQLKAQLRLADKVQAAYAVIFGEEELKEDKVLLRDMKTGKQEVLSIDDAKKKCLE